MVQEKSFISKRGKTMKKIFGVLMALMLAFCLCIPQSGNAAAASSTVKVKYKGVTKTYQKKINNVYVDGKKISLSKIPVFMKSGTYVGPLTQIFAKSALKVSLKKSGNKITLIYKSKKLTLTDGSRTVTLNGKKQKSALGTSPMRAAKYAGTSTSRWIVPLKSVCLRLGIAYQVKDGNLYIGTMPKQNTPVVNNNSSSSTTATKTETNQTTNTNQVVLVLDAGHGGIDSGATNKTLGLQEKNLNIAIVQEAKKYFDKDSRFKVYYTRTQDTYPSLDDRCKLANDKKADVFISVHINSASASAKGTETLYNNSRNVTTAKNGITSKELATEMQKAVVKTTGFVNRGLVNRTGLRVLNKTNMPACLIEYGFISNPTEAKQMNANKTRYGRELYQAIVNYMKAKNKIE